MATILKHLLRPVMRPVAGTYLSKDRITRLYGHKLFVKKGVFHPRMFYSTKTFASFLRKQKLEGLNVLEVGTGSGALAIVSAAEGARVTAVDINPDAVECAGKNAELNNLEVTVYLSDLFDKVPAQKFDRILVNPPFFPGTPQKPEEYAWYCGPEYEFFSRLFTEAKTYLSENGQIWMILSDECDFPVISEIAMISGFSVQKIHERKLWIERNIIYAFALA